MIYKDDKLHPPFPFISLIAIQKHWSLALINPKHSKKKHIEKWNEKTHVGIVLV